MTRMPKIEPTVTLGNIINTGSMIAMVLIFVGAFQARSEGEDVRGKEERARLQGQVESLQKQVAALTTRASVTETDVKYIRESLSRVEVALGTKPR